MFPAYRLFCRIFVRSLFLISALYFCMSSLDSRYNRYYYTNNHGRTQWDFPTIEETSTSPSPEVDKGRSDKMAADLYRVKLQ